MNLKIFKLKTKIFFADKIFKIKNRGLKFLDIKHF